MHLVCHIRRAQFPPTVYDTKAKPLPLIKGELEIPINVKVTWAQEEKLLKFKAKVEEVKYPMTGEDNDDSKSILNETGVHNDEDHYADVDAAHDDDEKPLEVEEQCPGDEEDVEIVDLEKCYIVAKKK